MMSPAESGQLAVGSPPTGVVPTTVTTVMNSGLSTAACDDVIVH